METKETGRQGMTYEDIEKAFLEEAGSFLSEEVITRTLEEERTKFLCADALEISPSEFVGNSISRYVKGLLRHHQPLPFFYEFLGFMMEASMLLLLYMLLYGAVQAAMAGGDAFLAEKEFLYALAGIGCYLLFHRVRTGRKGAYLLEQGKKRMERDEKDWKLSDADKQQMRKKAAALAFLPAAACLLLCAALWLLLWKTGAASGVRVRPLEVFLSYVLFALLSGIHNVIYSSFFVPYETIGGLVLARKPEAEVEQAVTQYKLLCYEQMLCRRGKTLTEFSSDDALAGELMQKLRGRMAVYRGYTLFGSLIFLVLTVVCVVQLALSSFRIQAGLCMFTLCSGAGTVLFLVTFLSASRVIKSLPAVKS